VVQLLSELIDQWSFIRFIVKKELKSIFQSFGVFFKASDVQLFDIVLL
jgi:hypothetical protein